MFFFLGFGSGKIDMKLEKVNFSPGEMIKGNIDLKMNKPTQARKLRVVFMGEKKTSSSGKRKSSIQTIHRFEQELDGEREYSGGNYSFSIQVPNNILNKVGPGGNLGTALGAASFLLGGGLSRVNWFVEASLDMPGAIDVKKRVQVNIVEGQPVMQ